MNKDILIQYGDLQEEIKLLREKIKKNKAEIEKLNKGGNVIDMVTGGLGGIQHFKIEGFPQKRYNDVKKCMEKNIIILQQREEKLLHTLNDVEEFISSVDDSRMRIIITLRVIEGLSWNKIADRLSGCNTEDSVRMAFNRFVESA